MAETTRRRDQTGPNNPNWRGGRIIEPRGYVLIRVGVGHPLADVRGYAYEHRLNAEKALGRALRPGEEVHHDDEIKGNNDPGNLAPLTSPEHNARHRKHDKGLRNPGETNPEVCCSCGCGVAFLKFDSSGRPRRFAPGHNCPRGAQNYKGARYG